MPALLTGLLALRSLLETLLNACIGYSAVPLGNCTYILDSRVVKGTLVRGRSAKAKVTRNHAERHYLTCI